MTQISSIPFRTRAELVADGVENPPSAWIGQPPTAALHDEVQASLDVDNGDGTEDELRDYLWQETDIADHALPTTQPEPSTQKDTTTVDDANALPSTRQSGIESADDLELRLSNEFVPIKEDNWDTVLYIGPPMQQHGESAEEYAYIKTQFSRPYLMRSQTLKDSGSAEFARRLGPMSARVARKLKNLGLHHDLPSDGTPKYWIDLRPMQNDEEALVTVAELTCTPGVLNWHNHDAAREVDPMIIKGRDALNTPKGISEKVQLPPGFFSKDATALKSEGREGTTEGQSFRHGKALEADYSPLRHHTALERLLHAIAGNNPKLNSAPKLWTFFAVAKMFDCALHPRVCNEIYTWIFSGVNSNFIAANPEVCYRIAMGTQSKMLLRVVFSILVGEKALHQACVQTPAQASASPIVDRNRALSHLDDDEINRIDHAARSLSLRVHKKFNEILEFPITWMTKSTEVFKLFAIIGSSEREQDMISSAIHLLIQHLRAEILYSLSQNLSLPTVPKPLTENAGYLKVRNFQPEAVSRYNVSVMSQRLLSQISWTFIKCYSIYRDDNPFLATGTNQRGDLNDVCAYRVDPRANSTRLQFEAKIGNLNGSIADGHTYYHDVHSHKDHLGDYEIRWDALYSAVCRNASYVSAISSERDMKAVDEVAQQHEQRHLRGVQAYESQHANSAMGTSATNWPDSKKGQSFAVDQHYTSAIINCSLLLDQLSTALSSVIESEILRPGYLENASGIEADINVDNIDTLLSLSEDEFKFLPLWADGCDDGSGGVFTETVPGAFDEDFQGGKRGLGPDDGGLDGLDDIEMGESFSVIDSREAESTVAGASKVATAGYGTDSVMSMDE